MSNESVNALAARSAISVTKSDVTVYSPMFDALYIGSGGTVTVVDASGNTIQFVAVPSGSILPVICSKVMSTGTAASDIVGLRY